MNSKVQDIMTPDPVGVYFDQTIADTARIMRDAQVGAVLVVNGESLAGVVTDRDLVMRGLAAGVGPDAPVGPLCSPKLVGVAAEADVAQAELLIKENAVRRLPSSTERARSSAWSRWATSPSRTTATRRWRPSARPRPTPDNGPRSA